MRPSPTTCASSDRARRARVLGRTLAGQGARVLMLESGRDLVAWLANARIRSLARYEASGDTDYPLSRTTSRLLGGNSNFWTGRCERFHPSDFEPHAYTPPENPWPITYADLDPYYDQAERLLRVRGGPRSSFSPPRRAPLPLPPSPDISFLKELGAALGVAFEESATATPTKTLRIFKVQRELLPAFLASERSALVTGVSVTRLLAGPDRRIVGAEVKRHRRDHEDRAGAAVRGRLRRHRIAAAPAALVIGAVPQRRRQHARHGGTRVQRASQREFHHLDPPCLGNDRADQQDRAHPPVLQCVPGRGPRKRVAGDAPGVGAAQPHRDLPPRQCAPDDR